MTRGPTLVPRGGLAEISFDAAPEPFGACFGQPGFPARSPSRSSPRCPRRRAAWPAGGPALRRGPGRRPSTPRVGWWCCPSALCGHNLDVGVVAQALGRHPVAQVAKPDALHNDLTLTARTPATTLCRLIRVPREHDLARHCPRATRCSTVAHPVRCAGRPRCDTPAMPRSERQQDGWGRDVSPVPPGGRPEFTIVLRGYDRRQVDEYLTAVEGGAVRPTSPTRFRIALRGYERSEVSAYIQRLASDMGVYPDPSAVDRFDFPR